MLNGQKDSTENTASDTTSTPADKKGPTSGDSPTASTGSYKDGTFKASGTYQSPGGTETVKLSVTLSDGTITATEMTTDPTGTTGKSFQEKFLGGYKSLVIGKKVDEVSLDRVAGSSLTSGGFNQALNQIKSDAQV